MAHLEKQAKDVKDREDLVPFTGEKRGMVIPLCHDECITMKAQWVHSRRVVPDPHC